MQSISTRYTLPFALLALNIGIGVSGAAPVTIRDVAFWRDMGFTDAGIQQKLAAATPPPSFSDADLKWLANSGVTPTVVASAQNYGPGKVPPVTPTIPATLPTNTTPIPPTITTSPNPPVGNTGLPTLDLFGGLKIGMRDGKLEITGVPEGGLANIFGGNTDDSTNKGKDKGKNRDKILTPPEMLPNEQSRTVITTRSADGGEIQWELPEDGNSWPVVPSDLETGHTATIMRLPVAVPLPRVEAPTVVTIPPATHTTPTTATTTNSLADAELQRGESLLRTNKTAEALAAFREAVRLDPTNADYHKRCGDVYSLNEQWPQAEASYREAARLRPTDGTCQALLGQTFQRQQKWVESEIAYREAVRLKPTEVAFQLYLGNTLLKQKKWPEATTTYRKIVRLAPHIEDAHAELAGALLRQERRDEAILEAKEALRLGMAPEDHWVFKELGLNP